MACPRCDEESGRAPFAHWRIEGDEARMCGTDIAPDGVVPVDAARVGALGQNGRERELRCPSHGVVMEWRISEKGARYGRCFERPAEGPIDEAGQCAIFLFDNGGGSTSEWIPPDCRVA